MLEILPSFLTKEQLQHIYFKLLATPKWYLTRGSNSSQDNGFGGYVFDPNEHRELVDFLVLNLRMLAQKKGYHLSKKILRVHAVVKQRNANVDFHVDNNHGNAYSFVGLLTPEWKPEWGGEFETEGKKIIPSPGQFLMIKSNQEHCGWGPKVDIPYWRLIINLILLGE